MNNLRCSCYSTLGRECEVKGRRALRPGRLQNWSGPLQEGMELAASIERGSVRLNIDLDYNNVIDAHFLRLVAEEGLTSIHGGGWVTTAGADPRAVFCGSSGTRAPGQGE